MTVAMRLAAALVALLALAVQCANAVAATPDGPNPGAFTAAGRFDGFRFEIRGACPDVEALQAQIVKAADQLSCFGWVQRSPADTIVGEARCNKEGAAYLRQYLQRGVAPMFTDQINVEVHQYQDTNIKLHFADFRRLDPTRRTCFDDLPHKCSLYETKVAASDL
jgi:hypothetical protein